MVDTQIIELAGRHYLISQMLKDGVEVALPIRDRGVDLIAYLEREEGGRAFFACPVQLKAHSDERFSLHGKYADVANLLLVYAWRVQSNEPELYALTYREAFDLLRAAGHTETSSWRDQKHYSLTAGESWRDRLRPYRMGPGMWRKKLLHLSAHPGMEEALSDNADEHPQPQLPPGPSPPSQHP